MLEDKDFPFEISMNTRVKMSLSSKLRLQESRENWYDDVASNSSGCLSSLHVGDMVIQLTAM